MNTLNKFSGIKNMVAALTLIGAVIAGTNPVDHTDMFVDARSIGMAGACTSTAFGTEAVFYNPAGLAKFSGREFNSMMATGLGFDRTFNFVGVASNPGFENKLSAAVAWINAGWGGGFQGSDSDDNSTGEFDVKENSILVSFAEYLDYLDLNWGATMKMLNSTIDNDNISGFGVDIGALYDLGTWNKFDNVVIGATIKDLYSKVEDEILDSQIKIGVSGTLASDLFGAFDLGYRTGDNSEMNYAFGVEYRYDLRQYGSLNMDSADFLPRIGINDSDLYFGFGIEMPKFTVDYAFVPAPNSEFNNSHRFSLVIPF